MRWPTRSRVPSSVSRLSMGKETCQRSRSDAAIWSRRGAFFSLIRRLRMLIVLFFLEILTGNNRLESSPMIRQLSVNDIVKDQGRKKMPQVAECLGDYIDAFRRLIVFQRSQHVYNVEMHVAPAGCLQLPFPKRDAGGEPAEINRLLYGKKRMRYYDQNFKFLKDDFACRIDIVVKIKNLPQAA